MIARLGEATAVADYAGFTEGAGGDLRDSASCTSLVNDLESAYATSVPSAGQ